MKKLFVIVCLAAGSVLSNSCGSSHYTVREQPVAPVYERPVSPGATYVWVDGGWRWRGSRYVYTNGYWARPRSHKIYVPGNWIHNNKGYYWRKGYWR